MFLLLSYLLRKWRERRDRILVISAGATARPTTPLVPASRLCSLPRQSRRTEPR